VVRGSYSNVLAFRNTAVMIGGKHQILFNTLDTFVSNFVLQLNLPGELIVAGRLSYSCFSLANYVTGDEDIQQLDVSKVHRP